MITSSSNKQIKHIIALQQKAKLRNECKEFGIEGIKMYRMFKIYRTNNPSCTSWTERNFGKVNVGIYNLRFITYKEKTTDTGVKLGRKEWCIQIGCHALWLDDIEDFIRYYHLEDKFLNKQENNNKKKTIKIKLK